MDDHKYTKLFVLQSTELSGLTPFCPEDQEIAEYFDGVIPKDEQSQLERHLADCRYCLARMGLLGRLQAGLPDKRVPGDVLATAKTLKHSVPARWQKRAPAWAAAALLVLGLGVLPQIYSIRQDSQVLLPATGGVEPPGKLRETRGINPMATGPRFLSLAEDLDAIPEGYLFRWTPVPDSRFYQVRIVSDSGDLLWQERITGTEWKIPAGTYLTPGTEYFVRVEAFLADTRSLKSVYLPFQVEEHR